MRALQYRFGILCPKIQERFMVVFTEEIYKRSFSIAIPFKEHSVSVQSTEWIEIKSMLHSI